MVAKSGYYGRKLVSNVRLFWNVYFSCAFFGRSWIGGAREARARARSARTRAKRANEREARGRAREARGRAREARARAVTCINQSNLDPSTYSKLDLSNLVHRVWDP